MELKNILLKKFFGTFKTEEDELIKFCIKNNVNNSFEILQEFDEIRGEVYDYIFKITQPNHQLFPSEISEKSKEFLLKKYIWIDSSGIKAIHNYLLWMCWHEGIMKNE